MLTIDINSGIIRQGGCPMKENVGIIGNGKYGDSTLESIFSVNGYDVWKVKRRHAKRELKKRIANCRVVVFDVENELEYIKEAKKRHALIEDIRKIAPRIEMICVVRESLCKSASCAMRCTKVTCKNESLSKLRYEIGRVIRLIEMKSW